MEELEKVKVDPDRPDLEVIISSKVPDELRGEVINFLQRNLDVFTCSHKDMIEIDPQVACHRLNIYPERGPISHKQKKFGPKKYATLAEEVKKHLDNNLIKHADQPQWVSKAVLVKKLNGTWRLCIDFTHLNEACPKDFFPMPHIDHLIDNTSGHKMMSFMDAFAGYHQIAR